MKANKNRSTGSRLFTRGALVAAIVLGTLFAVQAVMAASTLSLPHFNVSLLDYSFDSNDTSTWVYTITVREPITNGLSHIALGAIDCHEIEGDSSATSKGPEYDPTDGFDGGVIKWEGNDIKSPGETVTVTLTVIGATGNITGENTTFVSLKYGSDGLEEGYLDGPVCSTTAVDIADVGARSGQSVQMAVTALSLAATIAAYVALEKSNKKK